MLTPTDIHLLVGILSKLTTPENVEIVLGEMVYDEASQRKRDIDIIVKYKAENGEEVSFVGIQVKDHTRKLGSPEVEQLCLHFKDTPSIKKGGIVSASGYTKPAINKAKHHDIDLYHLKEWDETPALFVGSIIIPPEFRFTQVFPYFEQPPNIIFNIDDSVTEEEKKHLNEVRVYNLNGSEIPNTPTLKHLGDNLLNRSLQTKEINEWINNPGDKINLPFQLSITLEEPVIISLNDRNVEIKGAVIQGILFRKEEQKVTHFKKLVKLDDESYEVGCAICELNSGVLMGIASSSVDRSVKSVIIPVAQRNLLKINNLKLK